MRFAIRCRRLVRAVRKTLFHQRGLLFFSFLAAVAATGFHLLERYDMIGDEAAHFDQVKEVIGYLRGEKAFVPQHPALPGYHAILAIPGLLGANLTTPLLRFLSLSLSAASAWMFFRVARNQQAREAYRKTLQYVFLPLVFIFAFLLYTDIPSLLTIFLMAWATQRKKPFALAASGFLSILFRQNNVIWLAAFLCMAYVDGPGTKMSLRRMFLHMRRHGGSIAVFALFAAFVWWNGGVAIADRGSHPLSLHWGNVYAVLFTSFLFFLPLHVGNIRRIAQLVRQKPERSLTWLLMGFLFYMQTFMSSHYYNQDSWWLRNQFLNEVLATDFRKLLLFIPLALTVLSHVVTPLHRSSHMVFYPASILFLATSWLIEPRYYVIPLSLFLLFRQSGHSRLEWSLCLWNMIGSGILFWGLYYRTFLP